MRKFAEIVLLEQLARGVLLLDGAECGRRGEQRAPPCARRSPARRRRHRACRPACPRRGCWSQPWISGAVDDVGVADHPADVGGGPEDLAGIDAVDVLHRPGERHAVAAVVAHHALGLAGRARGVEDVQRVGRLRPARSRAAWRAATASFQSRSRPGDQRRRCLRALEHQAAFGPCARRARWRGRAAACTSTMRPGSMPHDAVSTSFGVQSSMRVASSLAAKPPNTTEWIAPSRAQASIAITASGIIGM